MTKAELVSELAEKAKVNKAQATRVLNELAEIACREAVNGFIVPGICKLSVVKRKERRCRIPSTGQLVLIGAHNALKVVPVGVAKNRVAPRSERTITVIDESKEPASAPGTKTSPDKMPDPEGGASGSVAQEAAVAEGGNIVFTCSECGAMISAPSTSAGEDGECPFCNSHIKIPHKDSEAESSAAEAVQADMASGGYIIFKCKDCGQEIECASSMGGMSASCPTCGAQVAIPSSSTAGPSTSGEDAGGASKSTGGSSVTMRIDLMDLE